MREGKKEGERERERKRERRRERERQTDIQTTLDRNTYRQIVSLFFMLSHQCRLTQSRHHKMTISAPVHVLLLPG